MSNTALAWWLGLVVVTTCAIFVTILATEATR